jgi:hypothetical protein
MLMKPTSDLHSTLNGIFQQHAHVYPQIQSLLFWSACLYPSKRSFYVVAFYGVENDINFLMAFLHQICNNLFRRIDIVRINTVYRLIGDCSKQGNRSSRFLCVFPVPCQNSYARKKIYPSQNCVSRISFTKDIE